MNKRIETALGHLDRKRLKLGLVTTPENIFYLTGFYPHAPASLLLKDEPELLITKMDSTRDVPFEHRIITGLKQEIRRVRYKRVGVETERVSVAFYNRNLKGRTPVDMGFLQEMRAVKDKGEIKAIKKAIDVTESCLGALALRRTEREAASELEWSINSRARISFDPIVAGGRNGAVPHHVPGDDPIDSPVIVDCGAKVDHYCADMTRTFRLDSDEHLRRYEVCLRAQEEAISMCRDGVKLAAVDKKVRDVLGEEGLAEDFIHSTGHGIGLEVHEGPSISKGAKGVFKKGMVVCIEPGIYRDFGIRIEDMVLVGRQPKVLTSFKK